MSKTAWTEIFQLLLKYSHLIFQMTSILTTISANRRPRPTNQVIDGSNNNFFIHSIKKCKSKSFHFDFALFLRTAIFLSLTPLSSRDGNSSVVYWIIIGHTQHSGLHGDFRSLSEALRGFEPMHKMAKSARLALVITAILASLFLERGLSQRQICSYYGMNLLSSCWDCYLAQVSLLYLLKAHWVAHCVLNRFAPQTHSKDDHDFFFSNVTKSRGIWRFYVS